MILVTGGLGFIGLRTTRALLEAGETCVLVQRREPALPEDLAGQAGRRVFCERADAADLAALLDVGTRHKITGIVHLAGSVPWPPGADEPVDGARKAVGSLLNVVQAAGEWQVPRVGMASTVGVYGGVTAEPPYREDLPLPMTAGHVIPAFKKAGELLAGYLADATGIEILSYRISRWGPGGNPFSSFMALPQLVHAAARGTAPDFLRAALACLRQRRARRVLRQGLRQGDRLAAARAPVEPPHLQHRLGEGGDQLGGRRRRQRARPGRADRVARGPPPGRIRPTALPRHHQAPRGHRLPARL